MLRPKKGSKDARDPSLHILQHALGLDDYGQGEPYRNHFVTGPECSDWPLCMAHFEAGRMERHEPRPIFGGGDHYCFTVTAAGKAFVAERSPAPRKQTRAQQRYSAYLRSGCDMDFGDWLKQGGARG
jgi:hypothetical protein